MTSLQVVQNIKQVTLQSSVNLDNVIAKSLEALEALKIGNLDLKGIEIARTSLDLIEVMKLRSQVFSPIIGFQDEFKDPIDGLNFDKYDSNSISLIQRTGNRISGTARIILDSEIGLQTETYYNQEIGFDEFRKRASEKNLKIAELSRLAIDTNVASPRTFRNLFRAKYLLGKELGISSYLASMATSHFDSYYSKFGMEVIKEVPSYGKIPLPCNITNWVIENPNNYVKKIIVGSLN